MTVSTQRRGITGLEGQSCPLRDGEMCERKAGTMSWRWRRNATSLIKSLGEEINEGGIQIPTSSLPFLLELGRR